MLAEQEKRGAHRGNKNARLSFTRARNVSGEGEERLGWGNKNGRVNEKREKSRAAAPRRRVSKRSATVH